MLGTCPGCGKPTVSKGMSCDSCIGEAHRPRPKRRAKAIELAREVAEAKLASPMLTARALAEMSDDTLIAAAGCDPSKAIVTRDPIIPPPIVEPPVYASRPPVVSEGRKYDDKKPRPALFPPIAMLEVGHVLAYGAEKYTLGDSPGQHNWKLVPNAVERYSDAMLRHIYAWLGGERNDVETGRHHLASVICCAAFILWFELTGREP